MLISAKNIAKICHEANRAYCSALKDDSQVPWEVAPAWQRESAVSGVEAVLENRANSAREQHEEWLKQKAVEGWGYGPVKDAENKKHPCFVPYDDLPMNQKVKDSLFRAIVLVFK